MLVRVTISANVKIKQSEYICTKLLLTKQSINTDRQDIVISTADRILHGFTKVRTRIDKSIDTSHNTQIYYYKTQSTSGNQQNALTCSKPIYLLTSQREVEYLTQQSNLYQARHSQDITTPKHIITQLNTRPLGGRIY